MAQNAAAAQAINIVLAGAVGNIGRPSKPGLSAGEI